MGWRPRRVGNAYLARLRSPRYLPLLGQFVSTRGDSLHDIAPVVLVFHLTGQGVAVVIVVVAEALPILVSGPVAGVVLDRCRRKAMRDRSRPR